MTTDAEYTITVTVPIEGESLTDCHRQMMELYEKPEEIIQRGQLGMCVEAWIKKEKDD